MERFLSFYEKYYIFNHLTYIYRNFDSPFHITTPIIRHGYKESRYTISLSVLICIIMKYTSNLI